MNRTMDRTVLSDVGRDLVAAAVVTTLLIPAGMGYAEAAGPPAITGRHATVVGLRTSPVRG